MSSSKLILLFLKYTVRQINIKVPVASVGLLQAVFDSSMFRVINNFTQKRKRKVRGQQQIRFGYSGVSLSQ